MVAEELFFGETSTGVAGDLQAATVTACQMVGLLGMGTTLVSSAAMEYPAGGIVSKVLSTDGGRAEVEDLLAAAKASVTQMLEGHRNVVEALRDALLERQELIGDDILAVIRESQTDAPTGAGDGDRVAEEWIEGEVLRLVNMGAGLDQTLGLDQTAGLDQTLGLDQKLGLDASAS